eukprot:TRINITY_DN3365_c0_g1_i3.p1 TRINITY_DN3365_c0_g1~~TRINITY_DN3365_c0_g1_i3.p1  ORF type:complete len:115 (+),score=43.38 TRINITY_DN3365_c0_g1_i3:127-471(+)
MKRVNFKSPALRFVHKMVRFRSVDSRKVEEMKTFLMEQFDRFLKENEGKILNVKVMKNNEICCYYVLENNPDYIRREEEFLKALVREVGLQTNIIELKPTELVPAFARTNQSGV